ncbi:hypothetical protein ACFLRC_01170 [Candidatus Altiarchaeota archaeon]
MRIIGSRGQASLEYLMTYGWAILIVLSLAVVAWNMGLLDIAGEVDPGQLGFWGIVPNDYKLETNGIFFLNLENQLDHNVTVQSVQVILGQEEKDAWSNPWRVIEPGNITETNELDSNDKFYTQSKGKNYRIFMNITYTESEQGFDQTHVSSGWVWSYVEP